VFVYSKTSFSLNPINFGVSFPQIFVVKFEKMKVVRKTPEFSKKVKISCIYKFLVVGNPQKLVPFLTVNTF